MTRILFSLFVWALFITKAAYSQTTGTVEVMALDARSLAGNLSQEPTTRSIHVYLPPGYAQGTRRYPVLYLLHGVGSSDTIWMYRRQVRSIMDQAIAQGRIAPMIVVIPNQKTALGGSFYANSPITGNWEDFTASELVQYIDGHYRTLAQPASRALWGHSMGGFGALRIALLRPGVFGVVYAMSPALLGFAGDMSVVQNPDFKRLAAAQTLPDLNAGGYTKIFAAICQAFAYNPAAPPLYIDKPILKSDTTYTINYAVLQRWHQALPATLLPQHAQSLLGLRALKIDWGRQDEFSHIPPTCHQFAQLLLHYGIPHQAEEYVGGHSNKLLGPDGRLLQVVLPYLSAHLVHAP